MGNTTTWLVIGGAAIAVLLLVLPAYLLLGRVRRDLAEAARAVTALQQENEELRAWTEQLAADVRRSRPTRRAGEGHLVPETIRGSIPADDDLVGTRPVPDQLVLSATLGEPVLKAAAFGHGVRRALSAESRNRIWFEVRREVRRSRKQRRRDMKAAYRHRQQRAGTGMGEA